MQMVDNYCNPKECRYFSNFGKLFYSLCEFQYFDLEIVVQHISQLPKYNCEQHLEEVLKRTVDSVLIRKYPIRKSYQLAFLKFWISQAEKLGVDFGQGYYFYTNILQNKLLENTSFKHYFAKNGLFTLREENSFVSSGTTGLCTWQGAVVLANWVLGHDHLIKYKKVLELGCGVGLTGIAILSGPNPPKDYAFTDHHPGVLELVNENLCINYQNELAQLDLFSKFIRNVGVKVWHLDWSDQEGLLDFNDYEVILGADIVFDPELIVLLADALHKLLNTQDKVAIIACCVRNQETIDYFIKNIEKRGLSIRQDLDSYPIYIDEKLYWIDLFDVNVYVIRQRDLSDDLSSKMVL